MTTPPAALTYALGDCELGPILLARSGRGLCALLIDDDPAALEAELGARFPTSTLQRDDAALAPTLAAAAQHIADPHAAPAEVLSELAPEGTEFQQLVWAALRRIKPGRTTTYAGLARILGRPEATRAVAGACAANPLAVLIPCHRVLRSDGTLSGYRWGLERKRALLDREQGSLFPS